LARTTAKHVAQNQMLTFVSKIEGALQELDETCYWLELIGESEILPLKRLQPLHDEADELMAILVTIVRRVKRKTAKRS
jgi:four helix bundle protein